MRDLVLAAIEKMRAKDKFSRQTMRWSKWYLTPAGVVYLNRKEVKQCGGVHLDETTNNGFKTLDDRTLLASYELLIRLSCKQM